MAGDVVRRETTRRRRDGAELIDRQHALTDPRPHAGVVIGAVGRLARRHATSAAPRTALQAAQARFQAAFEHAPIGIALVALRRRA